MILDYNYNKNQAKLNISYITKSGGKSLLEFNVGRFKTYFKTPTGRYTNWDGAACDEKYTSDPCKFDLHTYIEELEPKYKDLLKQKYFPKLYCFDIETEISDKFPEPSLAEQPITVISIASPELNTIVLGTRKIDKDENKYCEESFQKYLEKTDYFHELNLKTPYFKYIYFESEDKMLEYFLKNIVSKVPVLSGWNCLRFDWQYICNRIKNYYPEVALRNSSIIRQMKNKRMTDMAGNHFDLTMPNHTVIVDMMDVIQLDTTVLPIKESLSLNWIAEASLGIKKIDYDGSLQDLFENDYKKYIYYNTIDSVLVQLINYRFRCLDIIYQYSLYCNEKVEDCFSKIALTEALVFKDFYEHNIKVVYEPKGDVQRGRLIGAYVKVPRQGLYDFACCNDFASLYPSTIITDNLSFENYVGQYIDEEKIAEYRKRIAEYIVVGPNVYKNEGNAEKPHVGEHLYTFVDDAKLEPYRKDPNYFVSVNGCVYRNEKDYSFRRIQSKLKADRNVSKYFGKELDATIVSDISETLKNRCQFREYSEGVANELKNMGFDIKTSDDLKKYDEATLKHLKFELKLATDFYDAKQLAMKNLGNSMYGGSSHVSFYWFNMNLANDITSEAKNLTLMMERHFKHLWREKWAEMTDVHKMLGIEVDVQKCKELLGYGSPITQNDHRGDLTVYGDTDSIYSEYGTLLKTIKGTDKMSVDDKLNLILKLNLEWLDDHNCKYIADYFSSRHAKSVHKFELETIALRGAWLNVKKRYAQVLLWKDGKFYPKDDLPMKIKGLEIVQSSTPKKAREILLGMMRYILEEQDRSFFIHKINQRMMQYRKEFMEAPFEDICGNLKVNNYHQYILNDTEMWPKVALKCPANVRALAQYNCFRNTFGNGDNNAIYGGKLKWYFFKRPEMKDFGRIAFQAQNLPKWLPGAAPIAKDKQFSEIVLTPMNRVLLAMGMPELKPDGSLQMALF